MSEQNKVVTKVEIKGDNLYFWSDKSKYQIPCKMYPLSSKKNKACFHSDNTDDFNNKDLIDAINEPTLLMGHCYSNSFKVQESAKKKGINLQYYSGWLFTYNNFPIHHSWLVYEYDDKCSIIDGINMKIQIEANKEILNRINQGVLSNDDNWRKHYVAVIKELEMKYTMNSDRIICGKAYDNMMYVGSPDTMDNARKIFNDLTNEYPKHPSYIRKGQNIYGASKLQEEYYGLNN